MKHAEWAEANVRIKRLCPEAYVTYSRVHAYSHRWCAWERMTVPLTLDEDLLTQPGMTQETEAVVCSAPTSIELLHKYALRKRDPGFQMLFRDRVLRGEQSKPPPDPPEWAEYRKMKDAEAREAGERLGEQARATVRNFMAIQGLEMGKKERAALGIGRGAFWSKK